MVDWPSADADAATTANKLKSSETNRREEGESCDASTQVNILERSMPDNNDSIDNDLTHRLKVLSANADTIL